MSRLMQVIPRDGAALFSLIAHKESELRRRRQGTFHRAVRGKAGEARWNHVRYKGSIRLKRGEGGVITAEIRPRGEAHDEWQLLQAFIGFLDRHFASEIVGINIQFPDTR